VLFETSVTHTSSFVILLILRLFTLVHGPPRLFSQPRARNDRYGVAYVNGLQAADSNGHPRVNAYLKHFDAYSTETNRMHSDYNISRFDFFDSYLPQYKQVFTEANAAGAMCSYTAENGVPSCANSWLLNDVLRKEWGRDDA
jgi:beta-glucosidase-like glycosyl hydrolase